MHQRPAGPSRPRTVVRLVLEFLECWRAASGKLSTARRLKEAEMVLEFECGPEGLAIGT